MHGLYYFYSYKLKKDLGNVIMSFLKIREKTRTFKANIIESDFT